MGKPEARTSSATDEDVREHVRKMLRRIPRSQERPHLTSEAKHVLESHRIAVEAE
jgi:hypothetical protein